MYVVMVSGSSLSGVVLVLKASTLYLLIGMLLSTFGLGVRVTTFLAYMKLRKLK